MGRWGTTSRIVCARTRPVQSISAAPHLGIFGANEIDVFRVSSQSSRPLLVEVPGALAAWFGVILRRQSTFVNPWANKCMQRLEYNLGCLTRCFPAAI